jgi:tRNA A37 threonylcarbamoyladenosine biosynthesis protein TsaE
MATRKMLIEWPEVINKAIQKKQAEIEKSTGSKVTKQVATVELVASLLKESKDNKKKD